MGGKGGRDLIMTVRKKETLIGSGRRKEEETKWKGLMRTNGGWKGIRIKEG